MSILELFELIENVTFQLDWNESEQDIICFSNLFQFDTLTDSLLNYLTSLDKTSFEIKVRQDYFVFRLKEICEYYEIEIAELSKHLIINNRY